MDFNSRKTGFQFLLSVYLFVHGGLPERIAITHCYSEVCAIIRENRFRIRTLALSDCLGRPSKVHLNRHRYSEGCATVRHSTGIRNCGCAWCTHSSCATPR